MAAYLGLEGVPSATMAELPLAYLVARLSRDADGSADALKKKALLSDDLHVRGAEILWISDLDPDGLKQFGGVPALKKLLTPARPIDRLEPVLSDHVSKMVCFDYVIGNWDRFSGGNLFFNRTADRLVLIDHNGTFTPWGEPRKARMARLLKNTERFSASLIAKLTQMTARDIKRTLNEEPSHSKKPILTENEISLVLERRDALIAHVEALIKNRSVSDILVFE
jgi:hypothetical protein